MARGSDSSPFAPDPSKNLKHSQQLRQQLIKDKVSPEALPKKSSSTKQPRVTGGGSSSSDTADVEMKEAPPQPMEVDEAPPKVKKKPPPPAASSSPSTRDVEMRPVAPTTMTTTTRQVQKRPAADLRRHVLEENAKRKAVDRDLMNLLVKNRLKTLEGKRKRSEIDEGDRDRKRRVIHEMRDLYNEEKGRRTVKRGFDDGDDDNVSRKRLATRPPPPSSRLAEKRRASDGGLPISKRWQLGDWKRHKMLDAPVAAGHKRGLLLGDSNFHPLDFIYDPPAGKRANQSYAPVRHVGKYAGIKRKSDFGEVDANTVRDFAREEAASGIPFKSRPVSYNYYDDDDDDDDDDGAD